MSIVNEYLSLTKKYKADYGEKTILLMQVGSFFEVYALINPDGTYTGSNIVEFAKINDLAIANKNSCVGTLPVVMAGFGITYRDKYIQKTQEQDYTLVFHEQDPLDKTKRGLTEIISPGTFFPGEYNESERNEQHLSNNVMCIWLHKSNATKTLPSQVTLGIANIDIYTGKTALFQFAVTYNHSPATYDELERYIAAYKPSECLFVANLSERLIDEIIGFVGLERTKMHKVVGDTASPRPPVGAGVGTNAVGTNAVGTNAQTCSDGLAGSGACGLPLFAKNAEKQTYQLEILKRFFPQLSSLNDLFPTHFVATQAFCLLLDFVYQHNPNLVKKLSEPILENYTDRLILANHSLSQLNIIDDTRQTGKLRSVSSFLNNCVTTMGKRQFLYQLHYPITHRETLQASYDITEHMLKEKEKEKEKESITWPFLRQQLASISDLEKFTRQVVTRKVLPKHLVSLVADLTNIGMLHTKTQADLVLTQYLPQDLATIQTDCQAIINDITHIFHLPACQNLSDITDETLIINKGISPIIDALIKDSIDGQAKLEAICNYFSGLLQAAEKNKKTVHYVKVHETAKNPPVLLGTSLRIKKLTELLATLIKKNNKSLVEITYQSNYSETLETFELDLASLTTHNNGGAKNDLVITNKQIEQLTQTNDTNKIKLVREMAAVFQNYWYNTFAKFDNAMQQIIKYTVALDVLQCKCYIAHKYNYCKPSLVKEEERKETKSFFALTGLRHPLIEHLQTNELYVTNDLSLGETSQLRKPTPTSDKKDKANYGLAELKGVPSKGGLGGEPPHGILLYGTNAVGKTSFIKSVGIALIMAQAGLYVPCTSLTYQPYQTIFTRILGNDNMFKGLSTFAVEMTELRTILTLANANSLVLGDELCSGTESDSALSIFTAGLEILHERQSTFLFATHFHEITKYEEIKALTRLQMLHMAVHYDKTSGALVYDRKLREGPGESMYGLEVCKSLHLPDAFLQRAHAIRMKYHQETQNVLALSPTHFNAKKLVGNCELCQVTKASEVHHLQHQKNANKEKNNYIETFHKNHVANLLNICETCHQKIHQTGQQHKVVKTSEGYQLIAI